MEQYPVYGSESGERPMVSTQSVIYPPQHEQELHCYTGHWSDDAHLLSLQRDVGPYRPVVEGLPADNIIDIVDTDIDIPWPQVVPQRCLLHVGAVTLPQPLEQRHLLPAAEMCRYGRYCR